MDKMKREAKRPTGGKIHIVRNGAIRPKEIVLQEWRKTLFFRDKSLEAPGLVARRHEMRGVAGHT
jgi:hypothetical protein